MKKYFFRIVALILLAWSMSANATMTYIYNAPESALDKRYVYHWKILEMALQKTTRKYGPYRMVKSDVMTEQRQADELQRASGKLTVMYLDTSPELEKKLLPIRIPVDKGLVGYRVFLIRNADKPRFEAVKTLHDLKAFSYGLGLGWVDVNIMMSNHFKVVTGSSYEGLFEMLANKRFDAFPRGVVEVLEEYDTRKNTLPDLYIEPSILLYYPLPMYFWFSKTDEGRRMAARVEEGMWMMIRDGSYDRIFEQYQGYKIKKLKLGQRKLFKIGNPLLVPETPFKDKRLWFDLDAYQARHGNEPKH
jgi:ABC-type amino acid transport substrate-binding protein